MSWLDLIGPMSRNPAPMGLAEWYAYIESRTFALPLEQAVFSGRTAATPGMAFLGGYQAALRALWPQAPGGLGAFCATENRKLRPAEIDTLARASQLSGGKDFVTAGPDASWLLVTAREEEQGEPARLGIYALQAGSSGILMEPGSPLPLIPDIPHARVRFEQAEGVRLPGDGWNDYVVPFRTFEDLYVLAALSAWLYGLGLQQGWPEGVVLRLLAVISGAAEVARHLPRDPVGHVLLAALIEQFDALQPDVNAALSEDELLSNCWRRDRALLGLAREAKARRLQKAKAALGLPA